MNDDLNLLITFVSTSQRLVKAAITIEHGMNKNIGKNYIYYKEQDVETELKRNLPLHVQTFINFIVDVEEIFYVGESND